MTGQSVFVVMGTTGEYSDRKLWPVKAFLARTDADSLIGKLEEWCRESGCHRSLKQVSDSWRDREHAAEVAVDYDYDKVQRGNPFDPKMPRVDYTGVDYYVMEVELG